MRESNYGTLAHELAHEFGLWDQYCYFPNPENPNPTDFVTGQCKTPADPWHIGYCGSYKGVTYATPYQCVGDPNPLGGTTLMGSNNNSEDPTFAYSQKEFDYLSQKINCN